MMLKIILILFITAIILCFLYITIIILSKNNSTSATAKLEIKNNIKKSHFLSLSYFVLCLIKACMFLIPFLVPMIYLFIKISSQTSTENVEFHLIELFFVFLLTVFSYFAINLHLYKTIFYRFYNYRKIFKSTISNYF